MKRYSLNPILVVATLTAVLMSSQVAQAGKIIEVRGNKALVDLEGAALTEGQEIIAVDTTGKKVGLLKLTIVKNGKARADIEKGRAENGFSFVQRAPAATNPDGSTQTPQNGVSTTGTVTPTTRGANQFGIMGSYLMNSMNAKYSLSGSNFTANMKGSGIGVLGYYDYRINSNFQFRGMAGLEQYNVSVSQPSLSCAAGTSANCSVAINYLSGYGIVKYLFSRKPSHAWLGGGMGYMFALSKSSTVLDTAQISSNQVFTLSAGYDWAQAKGKSIPFSFDYNLFPSSPTVTASSIVLRVGYGF